MSSACAACAAFRGGSALGEVAVCSVFSGCAVVAVALNITLLFTRSYNEAQISDVIASVYSYNNDYENSSELSESVALEYFYL